MGPQCRRDAEKKRGRGKTQSSRKVEKASHRMAKGSRRVAMQNRRGRGAPTRGLPAHSEVATGGRCLAKDRRELALRRSLRAHRSR